MFSQYQSVFGNEYLETCRQHEQIIADLKQEDEGSIARILERERFLRAAQSQVVHILCKYHDVASERAQ